MKLLLLLAALPLAAQTPTWRPLLEGPPGTDGTRQQRPFTFTEGIAVDPAKSEIRATATGTTVIVQMPVPTDVVLGLPPGSSVSEEAVTIVRPQLGKTYVFVYKVTKPDGTVVHAPVSLTVKAP